MNCFNGFTVPVVGGHHAMLRFAEDGQAEPVLGPSGKPKLFPSELEAQRAVVEHLLKYFNGRFRREGAVLPSNQSEIARVFRKGRMIPVEHR